MLLLCQFCINDIISIDRALKNFRTNQDRLCNLNMLLQAFGKKKNS